MPVAKEKVHGSSEMDTQVIITYDHRLKRTGHPVRSAVHNLEIGGLVVGWVTNSEYPLLLQLCIISMLSLCH
ncbi:hypothetical protein V496_10470 [Pseudogymnoascus sp. VKM F-4515 (FW-2607)]|nr:hypothetical protein V496_10470 [Pseudogymnoascus sp. VKM F-4515 (FW-2607)]